MSHSLPQMLPPSQNESGLQNTENIELQHIDLKEDPHIVLAHSLTCLRPFRVGVVVNGRGINEGTPTDSLLCSASSLSSGQAAPAPVFQPRPGPPCICCLTAGQRLVWPDGTELDSCDTCWHASHPSRSLPHVWQFTYVHSLSSHLSTSPDVAGFDPVHELLHSIIDSFGLVSCL